MNGVFRLSLDEDQKQDMHGHPLHFLPGVKQDLQEAGEPLRQSTGTLDQAILEAASGLHKTTPFQYLLACWKRVSRLIRGFKKPTSEDQKYRIVREARRLCMSYCIFAVTMPEMFGRETGRNELTEYLVANPDDEHGLDHDFLSEMTSRFAEDDTVKEVVVAAVEEMSHQLAKMTMNDDYKRYTMALRTLVRFPALVDAVVDSPMFNLKASAGLIEIQTILGPYFQLSPLQGPVTRQYFSNARQRDPSYIVSSQKALRLTLQTHQEDLKDIIHHFIRASPKAKDATLDWFAHVVNSNHKRRALQVEPHTVASDGFMTNITVALDQLCEPFMDVRFSKIDRIDINYFKRHPRVDISDETKINADEKTSTDFWGQEAEGTSTFISEVFFLTLAAHHYGIEAIHSTLEDLDRQLKHMEKQIEKFELERHKYTAIPAQLRTFEETLKKFKDRVDNGYAFKYSCQGVLLEETIQQRSMQFMRYAITWLLRLVSPNHGFPANRNLPLPLPEHQPDEFKCLPEYFLEAVTSTFKFIMWNMPHIVTNTQADELVMLCITFLRSSEYVKNPYLKASLVTILFRGTWPRRQGSQGVLTGVLNSMKFSMEHLLHALMKFYIEAEHTGMHNQFYDKFNIRYEIFEIIKCVWGSPIFRENLLREAKVNLDFFVRFVNLLLNDVTYVLDESLSALVKIHDLQVELHNAGPGMEQAIREEKEGNLSEAQRKAKSYMQLTNETVAMLKLFTEALADSFTMPEIVQRLADMLDYNLDVMVGAKSANLKVENLNEYGFNPKALLSEIVDVYLNLSDKENFILAVARDGRSYKPKNFQTATTIVQKYSLKAPDDIKKWQALQIKFEEAHQADLQAEEDLGDIPEEFEGMLRSATLPCLHGAT